MPANGLRANTHVQALFMPHLGTGTILRVEPTRYLVAFPDADLTDYFARGEIEPVIPNEARAA